MRPRAFLQKPTVSLGKSGPVESQQNKGCKGCKRYERPATCNTTNKTRSYEGRCRFWEVCHAVTLACWFRFQPWGLGCLAVSLQTRCASFRIVWKRNFSLWFGWCRTSLTQLIQQMKVSTRFIFFARLWMGVGAPGVQKSISAYRLGIGLASLDPGNFWQSDMCSPGACFHNFRRNRFCRKVLCSSVCYSWFQSYTCLLLIYQIKVLVLGVHRIGFPCFQGINTNHMDVAGEALQRR